MAPADRCRSFTRRMIYRSFPAVVVLGRPLSTNLLTAVPRFGTLFKRGKRHFVDFRNPAATLVMSTSLLQLSDHSSTWEVVQAPAIFHELTHWHLQRIC
ncbi:hypothetical protein TNCV_4767181 [Trichonephila clavipes]|nr:hypothetical protein TNCV_4767181 [Trichonephila clavipes]